MDRTTDTGPSHQRAWELIPWLLNGRASAEERGLVEQHLRTCAACREELLLQRRLQAALTQETAQDRDPRAPFERLWRQIEDSTAVEELPPATFVVGHGRARTLVFGLAATVAVEAIGLAVFAAAWLMQGPAVPGAAYRTLSASGMVAPAATLRVVLAPDMRLEAVNAMLARSELQIVGGPSESGVYSLAPRPGSRPDVGEPALVRLRAQPGVLFVEPVGDAVESAQ